MSAVQPSSSGLSIGDLTGQFTELALAMIISHSEPVHGARVVQFATLAVPGSEHAALTVTRGPASAPFTVAGSSALTYRLDALQWETGEGPGLQTLTKGDISRADDLASDSRWPHFGPLAVQETGVRSMFSVRLHLSPTERGALNFYAAAAGAFTDLDIAVGSIFAAYASLALTTVAHQARVGNLEIAVESNRQIGMATGILMARQLWTSEQAFAQLKAASQHLNRKLADIAAEVTTTGTLPDFRPKPSAVRAPFPTIGSATE